MTMTLLKPFNTPTQFMYPPVIPAATLDTHALQKGQADAAYQAASDVLGSLAGLSVVAGKGLYGSANDTLAMYNLSTYMRSISNPADQAAFMTSIGLGTGDEPTFAGLTVTGDVVFSGTSLRTTAEQMIVNSNFAQMNSGYTGTTAQTGGMVIIRGRNGSKSVLNATGAGVFTPGVDGVSDPSVTVAFNLLDLANQPNTGDIVYISGTTLNSGLYEVSGRDSGPDVIYLRSTNHGETDRVLDFTLDDVQAEENDAIQIQVVNVTSVRASGTTLQVATGSSSSAFTYKTLFTTSDAPDSLTVTRDSTNYDNSTGSLADNFSGIDTVLGDHESRLSTAEGTISTQGTSISTLQTDVGSLQDFDSSLGGTGGADLIGVNTSGTGLTGPKVQDALQALKSAIDGVGSPTPHDATFNNTSSWTLNNGVYKIAVSAGTHGKGTKPTVDVWSLVSGDVYQVDNERVIVQVDDMSGDFTIYVSGADDRFAGKYVVR